MRVWDVLFNEGAGILFRVALAVFKVQYIVYHMPTSDAFYDALSGPSANISEVGEGTFGISIYLIFTV